MNKDRIEKLLRPMGEAGLDGLLICPSEELQFLTGFTPMMCERFQGLFITSAGEGFYVCNLLYTAEVENAWGEDLKVYSWRDGESMTDLTALALKSHGLMGGRIGVNSSAQAFNTLEIAGDCGVDFVNAMQVLEEARIIKTPGEIESLRRAARITDEAFAAALDFIKPGITEGDILTFLSDKLTAAGGDKTWGIIASGVNSSFPHYMGKDRVIGEKDIMILDFGCTYNGLYSDMSRTIFVGGITDEQRQIYELVRRSNEAGERAAVNGAFIPDVDASARDVIVAGGYGDMFISRLGHGIGYMIHEAPDIKKNNARRLEPGMAFSIEPGISLRGEYGMRIEDIVVVTESGSEVLNRAAKDLIIL